MRNLTLAVLAIALLLAIAMPAQAMVQPLCEARGGPSTLSLTPVSVNACDDYSYTIPDKACRDNSIDLVDPFGLASPGGGNPITFNMPGQQAGSQTYSGSANWQDPTLLSGNMLRDVGSLYVEGAMLNVPRPDLMLEMGLNQLGIADDPTRALWERSLGGMGVASAVILSAGEFLPVVGGVETAIAKQLAKAEARAVARVAEKTVGGATRGGVITDPARLLQPAQSSAKIRTSVGMATGGSDLPAVESVWLRGTAGNAGRIPRQIAERLRGRSFASFDEFRAAFWKEVSADPVLSKQFSTANQRLMAMGKAPFVTPSQVTGLGNAQQVYNLHHLKAIEAGGPVYDMDNIIVASPTYHGSF